MKQTEIPAFLAHLKIYNGFPVPFIQLWAASKLDFRAVNTEHCARRLRDKLCAIRGRRLGEYCYFIGGPLTAADDSGRTVVAHYRDFVLSVRVSISTEAAG